MNIQIFGPRKSFDTKKAERYFKERKIKVFNSKCCKKYIKTWIWCICKASHTEHEVVVGKQIVNLQPGQFVFGRLKFLEHKKGTEK